MSRTLTSWTLNGLGAQTHRQCSWRRRCCCSCHRSRCDCNGRQESPTAAAVGLPPSRSPWRRPGVVDGNRTAALARDSTNPASIDRLRFVMDEGPPARSQSIGRKVPVTAVRPRFRVSGDHGAPWYSCRCAGMSGLRPCAPLTGEVRYRIDAFVGHCPGRRVSQTVSPH